jgi:arsenate reductase-like glutaredoxin family protein
MAHTAALVEVLKRELKTRGVTYADLAKQLRLSEASVKRMFSRRDFTLKRLDEICRHAQIDFSELARAMVRDETLISHLTPEQEKEIVADRKLFLVAVCALNQVTFDQIVETYAISTAECVQLLARLDKLKFIELQPGNRIKLLVSRTFSWLPDGPIQRFFNEQAHMVYRPLIMCESTYHVASAYPQSNPHIRSPAIGND